MTITVINGSPKGKYSITLQTVRYLEIKYPAHKFEVLNVGQRIKQFEKDMNEAKKVLSKSDAVIFAYPVYTFLAPSQLHRFIELLKSSDISLDGRFATQITTSKHFYDVTAHKYVEENALDLGMRYVRGLSADMEDLLTEKGREYAENFFDRFIWSAENGVFDSRCDLKEEFAPCVASVPCANSPKYEGKDIVIVTDVRDNTSNLSKMISRFQAEFPYKTRTINLNDISLDGGCLGCFRCAVSEKCVYKDGFDAFLRDNIQRADAIVYAFEISDHSMGSKFKMYDDRNFCNGHRTVTVGMPVGYIISGRLSVENNLRTVVEARSETGGNFLSGVASDEFNADASVDKLVRSLAFAIETNHTAPQNFWGVGGMKIFRDLIYQMRGMMRADHKFYKKHGIYDFPQKKWQTSLKMYLVGMLLSNEKILSKMGNKMNEGMLMPYEKMFEKLLKE